MKLNLPKNDARYHWTNHVVRKMLYYGLSADRVKRVMRGPKRSEKGIAPDTIAVMQEAGTKQKPTEVWVMYAHKERRKSKVEDGKKQLATLNSQPSKKIVITAWRYPGKSPIRDETPTPADILEELKSIKY